MSALLASLIENSPIILPEDKEKCKTYFLKRPAELDKWFFDSPNKGFLRQGDIISNCTFPVVMPDENGKDSIDYIENTPGILLNATCDMQESQGRDENLLIAPVLGFDFFLNDPPQSVAPIKWAQFLSQARASMTTDFLYLPSTTGVEESLVPLYRTCSVDMQMIHEKIRSGETSILASLTRIGWYFFITKLSYYFTRYEDEEELGRAQG